jgi:menaquinone-dependent protoporphyrinogen oxidase
LGKNSQRCQKSPGVSTGARDFPHDLDGTVVAFTPDGCSKGTGVMHRILVIHGTTEGHTEMIATAIANNLTARGFQTDIIAAGTIDPPPSLYDGIIVAASVRAGHYQKTVAQWLKAHVAELRVKPTAFVSACLGVVQHDPKVDADLDAIVHRFIDPIGWQPTMIKPVAGVLLYTKYNLLMRWMMKRNAARAGGATDTSRDYDYTDSSDLRAFSDEFGRRVAGVAVAQ